MIKVTNTSIWSRPKKGVDYNPSNNLYQNQMSLCHQCHAKTNKSKREFWTQHCQVILSEKYGYKYTSNNDILIELKKEINTYGM